MLASTASGLALGLSLIVAIGAQNLFVLRQGIRREHALAVALVCAASDAILIAVGVSGLGAVLHAVPWLIDAVRWAGAVFLAVYAVLAARRSLRPGAEVLDAGAARAPGRRGAPLLPVLLTCLALTWLNPHVYLDTVFLLGSVANTHGAHRWWFAAGAMAASLLWFSALALGARYLARWLATPRAWRVLDGVIAVVMMALAVSLVWPR
ncbi:LysE/ArgO family amino acid transporter [Microbacterium lacticum]|uniref:L-lysine exporter family protein LysE/ArgO n=1 Tax=Microbacterium lacticum TaxID=33885 RepID=A0A4Y3UMA7_9MICO|nr:LysE/ArgO family amino acid transporter [Microbacterium lacticum]TQM98873.1 L-lysine exporter family protein LysE/ArgO [Microbacterium lacticum]GEB94540.1 amino acid transporter [Microbacterium lacticum]GGN18141.1 amino acid transporter [Microbacterium lacticum]